MECAPAIGLPPQESQSAISRLPPEVLGDIFLQNVLQLPIQRGSYYGLFSFLFVCWEWYNVARCSPHLWCHLGNNINHWPVFVALSKGMDLFIHMYDIYGEYRAAPDDRLTAMFQDHDFYSRIREFTLDGLVDVLSYVFPEGAPRPSRLVSLSIAHWVVVSTIHGATEIIHRRSPSPPIPELLVESSSESLRRLKITACIPDIDQLTILRQLTHLSLTDFYSPDTPGHPTIKQLLLVLQANPDLEELLLSNRACGLQEDDDEELPFVSFTRLRKLVVNLHIRDLAPLVQHLRIVSEVEEIELGIEVYAEPRDPIPETVSGWFNDVVSPHAIQCIETRPASDMFRPAIKYVRKSNNTQHPNLPHHSCFVELRFERQSELSAFLALETLHNATRLELFRDDLSAYQYLGIFEMVPMLRELVIWVGQECNSVRALLPVTQYSQEDLKGNTYLSYTPLRNLSYLRVIEADLRDIKGEDNSPNRTVILNFVRQRKLLGLGLQRLELVCCKCVPSGWVDELRRFVPDTLWDGEGGVGGVYSDDSDEDYRPSSCDSESDCSDWETISHDSDEDLSASSFHVEDSDSDGGETNSFESADWRLEIL